MSSELWQLYDEQGRPVPGKGGTKAAIHSNGILHGCAHVWIWRIKDDKVEVLLQKRSSTKPTWPGKYDISAAGHIDLNEDPLTSALRETREELGLNVVTKDLRFAGVERQYLIDTHSGMIENELCWVYTTKLKQNSGFKLSVREIDSIVWKLADELKADIANPVIYRDNYVPQSQKYYQTVFDSIESSM